MSVLDQQGRATIALSRYILLERLAAGGAGTVYRAYDPDLERRVAIKLLHAQGLDGREEQARLVAEARALAALTHPNVVAIYDVGTYQPSDVSDLLNPHLPARGVFMVMELVEGSDLRAWLHQTSRPREDIVRIFVAAGRGLAAAHRRGIVHRDFKPANVCVGKDGRVCILDFGLAMSGDRGPSVAEAGQIDDELMTLQTLNTAGTPAYMAPEQHRGFRADARSDQFSFGVALYEALFSKRPFSGSSFDLAHAKTKGLATPLPSSDLPSHVRRVIERALSPNPDDRFSSMNELLEQLEPKPKSRPLWHLAATVAGIGGVAMAALWAADPGPCDIGQQRAGEVWNAERRGEVENAFVVSDAPFAQDALSGVTNRLDEYTGEWAEKRSSLCRSSSKMAAGEQGRLHDLRVACLGRALNETSAVIGLLARADDSVVEKAVETVHGLPRLGACEDPALLRARLGQHLTDPKTRAETEAAQVKLLQARAMRRAGLYPDALNVIREVSGLPVTENVGHLNAEIRLVEGTVLADQGLFELSERALLEAAWSGEAHRAEEVTVDALVRLVWVVGVELQDTERGRHWARFAQASLDRMGEAPLRQARLDHNLGGIFYRERDHEQALAHYRRALSAQLGELGEKDPLVAQTLNHIANVMIAIGRPDESFEYSQRSLAIRRATLGNLHPAVAASLNNIAAAYARLKRPDLAYETVERSLSIVAGSGGPEELVASVLAGRVSEEQGRLEAASLAFTRVAEIRAAKLGDDSAATIAARQHAARLAEEHRALVDTGR